MRSSTFRIFPVLALAAFAACSDGPTGNTPPLDLEQVQAQDALIQQALSAPVLHSLFGGLEMEPGFGAAPALSRAAVDGNETFASARAREGGMREAVRAAIPSATLAEGESWYVQPEQWGRTFVKDPVNGGVMWDPNRTDAPARGVRIVLYQRTGPDTYSNSPVGALDIIDSSTTEMQVGRLNLYDGGGQLVGSFRETATVMTDATTSLTATFTGTVGIAPRTFTVADTMSGSATHTATGTRTNLRWRSVNRANFTQAEFALLITGMDLGSAEETGTGEMSITLGEHVTRLVGAGSSSGVAGDTRIYNDGTHVATADGDTGEWRSPTGGQVAPRVQTYVMHVMMAAMRIPNSLMLRLLVLMMIPF